MSETNINRRDFLKIMGLESAALGTALAVPKLVGRTANGVLLESKEYYGGFLVEKRSAGDPPYEIDPNVIERMDEKFTIFSRNRWDPERQNRPERGEDANLTKERLIDGEGKVPNQTRLDYALMAASWATAFMGGPQYGWEVNTGMIRGMGLDQMEPWDPADLDMSWEQASLAVKHAATFYGASLAGIAELNPLWLYGTHYAPSEDDAERTIPVIYDGDRLEQTEEAWYIPKSMNRVVALAFEEDYAGISNSPGRVASAAVGDGYSRMAFTSFHLAEFIRALGYRALPAGNGVGLSVPMAIDAGLGEYGRLNLLITPKYGPRVRLAKVITDMPLIPDAPIRFGVTEFCEACELCATHCPSGTLPTGPRTWEPVSASNNPGALKWYAQLEGCYDFNGFSCSNCKRVCPFNKPNNSWLHGVTRQIVQGKVGALDKLLVALDQAGGYGVQKPDTEFWAMDPERTIAGRDRM
ncbi:MAG: reductive dehalogenase [Anaerolineales bacterium]